MAKPGPKLTPTVLMQVHGNPGRRPLNTNEPEALGTVWAPPKWFDEQQREQWDYAIEWMPRGLLAAIDREALVIWIVACVEHARAVIEVRKLGQVVKTKDGNAIQNPFLPIVNKQALIMLRAAQELGFTPAARAGFGSRAPEIAGHGPAPTRIAPKLANYLDRKPDRLN
jgi:P27 family predicted phage terminase small subunit